MPPVLLVTSMLLRHMCGRPRGGPRWPPPARAVPRREGHRAGAAARPPGRHQRAAPAARVRRAHPLGRAGAARLLRARRGDRGLAGARAAGGRGGRRRRGRDGAGARRGVPAAGHVPRARRDALHQLAAGPRRGRHLRRVQPQRTVPGEWLRRHDRAILGHQHRDAALHLHRPQALGAQHRLGSRREEAGVGMQEQPDPAVGPGDGAAGGARPHGAHQVDHVAVLGAAAPERGGAVPGERLQGRHGARVGRGARRLRARAGRPHAFRHVPALGRRGPPLLGLAGPHRQSVEAARRRAVPHPAGPRPLGELAGAQHGLRDAHRRLRAQARHRRRSQQHRLPGGAKGTGAEAIQPSQGGARRGAAGVGLGRLHALPVAPGARQEAGGAHDGPPGAHQRGGLLPRRPRPRQRLLRQVRQAVGRAHRQVPRRSARSRERRVRRGLGGRQPPPGERRQRQHRQGVGRADARARHRPARTRRRGVCGGLEPRRSEGRLWQQGQDAADMAEVSDRRRCFWVGETTAPSPRPSASSPVETPAKRLVRRGPGAAAVTRTPRRRAASRSSDRSRVARPIVTGSNQ